MRRRRWTVAVGCALGLGLLLFGGVAAAAPGHHGRPTPVTSQTSVAFQTSQTSVTYQPPCYAARQQLLGLMAKVTGATASSYQTRDSTGYTTDTIKLVQILPGYPGAGQYLGVYHDLIGSTFSVRLGISTDLLHWRYVTTIATGASQPTIFPLAGGAFLVAYEKDDPGGFAHLEFRAYPSVIALGYNQYNAQFDAPRTLSSIGEGTPNIRSVTSDGGLSTPGDLSSSTIRVGFHYFDTRLGRDRQGLGTLTDFSDWSTQINTQLNSAFSPMPGGEIGGRDYLVFQGCPFTTIEAQSVLGDWGSWHVYLYDETSHTMTRVPVQTAGGSQSMGNPKFEVISDPAGHRALAVSYFIFAQGSAPGEAGPLVFYTDF